jgi:hypothetical protein
VKELSDLVRLQVIENGPISSQQTDYLTTTSNPEKDWGKI